MHNQIESNFNSPVAIGQMHWNEDELAKELGWSRRQLRRLHLQRLGPPRTQIGRKIFYNKESVLTWLRSLEEKPLRTRRKR